MIKSGFFKFRIKMVSHIIEIENEYVKNTN